jgi:preprotein translocase subunit SecE
MPNITITCPHCGLAKDLPEEKVPKSEVQVTCPRCKQGFLLSSGRQAASPVMPSQEPVSLSPSQPTPVAATSSKPAPLKQSWNVSSQFRHLFIVISVLAGMSLLSSALAFLTSSNITQIMYLQTAIHIVITLATIAIMLWRLKTPLYELSSSGIRVTNIPFASGRNTRWQDIIGLVVRESGIFGVKNVQVRLLLGGKNSPLRELLISPKIAERPDELLAKLQEQIPHLTAALLAATGRLEKKQEGEVRFGSHILSRAGIAASRNLIPWTAVSEINTPQFVLAGYGSVTISYSAGMKTAKLTVAAKMVPEYQEFIRTILCFAPQAVIDPGVAKILDYPPQEAKKESMAILLLVLAMVLTMAAIFLAVNYVPVVPLKAVSSLATAAAGIIPFVAGVGLFAGRFQGRIVPASKTLAWSGTACGGPVVVLLLLLLSFPSARYALRGDLAFRGGDLDAAAQYFTLALATTPDNLDASFALGMVYREKKDYARAFECLQKVYLVDSKNWEAFGMELIPDTLLKMGRYDEAIGWCDRIQRDHPRRRSIAAAMENKKSEILRAKGKSG